MSRRTKSGFTLVELMIVVVVGVLAAIAIPGFTRLRARAKQAEVKSNLKALYVAQRAYAQEKDSYSRHVREIGFRPERGNRYAYVLNAEAPLEPRSAAVIDESAAGTWSGCEADTFAHPSAVATPTSLVVPEVVLGPLGWFTAVASGNIDNDPGQDEWSISSKPRAEGAVSDAETRCATGNAVSGEPCQDVSDV